MEQPNENSSIYEVMQYLRRLPTYSMDVASEPMAHPFHKRYHSKPQVFTATCDGYHLVRFKLGTRDAESLEVQKNGLPEFVIVTIGGKQWNFKTPLEAECFIADYLGA